MARNIDRVMHLIIEANELNEALVRDANMLLQGLSPAERLNIIQVAIRSWQNRQGAAPTDSLKPT